MDTRTGKIFEMTKELRKQLTADTALAQFLKPMVLPPTEAQMQRKPPRVGRNEPCPCGSGRKFKKCCFVRESAKEDEP